MSLLIVVPLASEGCAPKAKPDFDSPDSNARAAAIEQAVNSQDMTKIPQMIALLDSDDPLIRMMAIRSLERMTGQTLGYEHSAPEWQRRDRADAWAAWAVDEGYAATELAEERELVRAAQGGADG